jgi:hypothetical protein
LAAGAGAAGLAGAGLASGLGAGVAAFFAGAGVAGAALEAAGFLALAGSSFFWAQAITRSSPRQIIPNNKINLFMSNTSLVFSKLGLHIRRGWATRFSTANQVWANKNESRISKESIFLAICG